MLESLRQLVEAEAHCSANAVMGDEALLRQPVDQRLRYGVVPSRG